MIDYLCVQKDTYDVFVNEAQKQVPRYSLAHSLARAIPSRRAAAAAGSTASEGTEPGGRRGLRQGMELQKV